MNQSIAPAAAMIAGLVLMFVGYWYQAALPVSVVWSDEQAQEYSANAARLHSASFGPAHDHSKAHGHSHAAGDKSPEYLAAKAAFDKSRADLDRAISRQSWVKYGIVLAGVAIAGWGVVQVAIEKMKSDEATTTGGKARKH